MPQHRFFLDVGSPIAVEVQQRDCGRIRVTGVLDRVPLLMWGGYARCLVENSDGRLSRLRAALQSRAPVKSARA
jgi:hypothetical protein